MERELIRREDMCPQLLNLIPDERVKHDGRKGYLTSEPEEMKLELRLGLPGREEHTALHSLAPLPKRWFLDTEGFPAQQTAAAGGYLQLQGVGKELLRTEQQSLDKKKAAATAAVAHAAPRDAAGGRSATVPVVGWPPIRSFRKNLASSSSKPLPKPQNTESESQVKHNNCRKGFFVKINMDGIPIGRKVDLKAYDSYEKLSSTVEELFQGLLKAQSDPSTTGSQNVKEKQVFTGLLDGSGEYTLVYEDNEGDRMLVGDVPWDMFVLTAKRLRVMKSSELPALCGSRLSVVNCKRRGRRTREEQHQQHPRLVFSVRWKFDLSQKRSSQRINGNPAEWRSVGEIVEEKRLFLSLVNHCLFLRTSLRLVQVAGFFV